ncbi:uncharacterized protein LOC105181104 isoform X2 [Harpegnathos saltator]|uniref:uncharacterized protein LOC105181104 isoform X2 n=1 Tax=Harpegnathos saltator TaxID=610380 RepID=UPI000948C7A3|nr:uncharacterized protein LOC105181104 isoform X2 [Harpegnathos saltator]
MMEKKGLRKKDMLRMDGLLPPTRRLPVCDAVSGASDKKKDKKWSIGGILRRISSIRDYDSSSNDEEIVYCKRTPRKPTKLNRQTDGVVLHSIENNPEHDDKRTKAENNVRHSASSPQSQLRRDSLHSRSSDGSLDGLGKKTRKNKLKARAEAKRDNLCADSSSDEDCRRSNGSLNRFHGADGTHNGQRNNMCNRKTRAARTERYIKRLSRDDGNGSGETLNDPPHKRITSEYPADDEQQQQRAVYADVNGSCRPPVHPRRAIPVPKSSSNRAHPLLQRSSVESLSRIDVGLPDPEVGSFNDFRRYSAGQYVTDMNQNNTYGKISSSVGADAYVDRCQGGNFFTYPVKNVAHCTEPFDRAVERRLVINQDNEPPEPPPRDPRYRVFGYGYNSCPTNRHQQNVSSCYERGDGRATSNVANGLSRLPDWRNFRSYSLNNEDEMVQRYDANELENPMIPKPRMKVCNSLEYVNNRYNSSQHCANESLRKETELTKCRRRNIRNDHLNDVNFSACVATNNTSVNICESRNREISTPRSYSVPVVSTTDWSSRRSPCDRAASHAIVPKREADKNNIEKRKEENRRMTPAEELERRRSSKNLEEALSELEAIYNSLRLGDEDLLDRAERRSMEEFSLKRGRSELDAAAVISPDSPDRTKDDMAYRRMHPKERPTSLSDIAGQSALSNISYLMASPVLSRRDPEDDDLKRASPNVSYSTGRRDEPDVTRDDMVFRSINHANNTLRVIDPQPPFGIPLGPVSAATESDYLHTTPTKSEQPRSPYIPQCEPDVVTDDLAYRALRKDAGAARNGAVESKADPAAGVRKKRAVVRSLSANLYGLINHDRIHLRREPSLDAIKDEIQDVARSSAAASERAGYLRRVVSDGELSDNDVHRRRERSVGTDINGNHPTAATYRKKLSDVYDISPEMTTTTTRESPRKEPSIAEISDVMLSPKGALGDEFWHEYLRPDSNTSNANSNHSTEADFSAYSRLCQDLVNLIKGDDELPNTDQAVATVAPADNKSRDIKREVDELSTGSRARSSADHYSGCQRAVCTHDKRSTVENTTSSTADSAEPTSTGNLDFYLRVADENVKLIAAAFGSVADHMRDSRRFSMRKNSLTSRDVSEIENRSVSTRSSTAYSPDDACDVHLQPATVVSPRLEEARVLSKRDSFTSNEGDQGISSDSNFEQDNILTADVELDLSRAVRDLQLAAASLCEHEREIEDLGIARDRKIDTSVRDTTSTTVSNTDEHEGDSPIRKINLIIDVLRKEQERHQKEEEEEQEEEEEEEDKEEKGIHNVTSVTTISEDEKQDKSLVRKISLIADDLRQERERDQEEVMVLPSGVTETRRGVRKESCEGLQALARSD